MRLQLVKYKNRVFILHCVERVAGLRVLVTGGAGFIGSHTVDKLIAQGAEVVVVDNLSTGKEENLNPAAEFVRIDTTSEHLTGVFEKFNPEYVIHLAAQVSVANSINNPVLDSLTNIVGSVNLLENCRRFGVKKVVYSSSAAVYGNPEEVVVSETTATGPLSFYGISKLTPEYYFNVFNNLYGLKYTVLRYANIYGPRQDALGEGGVISIFATRILTGQSPTIHGDGEQTRDFVYVGDVANANIKALTGGDLMTLNVGTGMGTSINQLFTVMAEIIGSELQPQYAGPRPGDVRHSCMDNGRITKNLKWQPQVSLKEGLANTLAFYRNI